MPRQQSYWMNRRYSSLSTCSPSSVTANRLGTRAVPSRNFSSLWLRTMSNTCCFDIRLAGGRLPLLEEPKPASGMKRILNSHDLYACSSESNFWSADLYLIKDYPITKLLFLNQISGAQI